MIEMRDVGFAYPRGGALFQGITLDLPRGSFQFLTGPSGSGKTTFLRLCIADLLPSSGTLTVFGQDAARLGRDEIAALRRRIGLVQQDTQFLDHLPVAENIALPMIVAGEPVDTGFRPQGSQDRPRLLEALAAYGTAQTSETPHEGAASASQNQETAP